jgi:hypothetical protein
MASSDDQVGSNRPNIVFVPCDNVGWGDFGVYGGARPPLGSTSSPARASRLNNRCAHSWTS